MLLLMMTMFMLLLLLLMMIVDHHHHLHHHHHHMLFNCIIISTTYSFMKLRHIFLLKLTAVLLPFPFPKLSGGCDHGSWTCGLSAPLVALAEGKVAVAGWVKVTGWYSKWKTVEDELMAIYKPCITLQGTNISRFQGTFEDDFPFSPGGIC